MNIKQNMIVAVLDFKNVLNIILNEITSKYRNVIPNPTYNKFKNSSALINCFVAISSLCTTKT